MVVLKVEPWECTNTRTESQPASREQDVKELEMFGFQDLASDYYQVLRQKSRPGWCRLVWAFVILILLIFTGYMVYQLLSDYFKYNSFVESHIKWQRNVTLPAITICNTNPLNYTALKQELADTDPQLLDDFVRLMDTYIVQSSVEGGIANLDMSAFYNFTMWEYMAGSLVLQFKPHLYNMLFGRYDYMFRGIGYYINSTDWATHSQMTELGVCFELNDDGKLQQNTGGVKGGLVVDLDANVQDYLFSTGSKGFVVYIRDQDETIMLDRGGYVMSPGSESFLKLTKYSHKRLGSPHGTCADVPSQFAKYTEQAESVRECVQRQRLDAMVEMCHCIPWYLAERLHTLGKTDVLDEYAKTVRRYQNSHSRRRRDVEPTPTGQTPTGDPNPADPTAADPTQADPSQADPTPASPTNGFGYSSTETPFHRSNYTQLSCGFVEMLICDNEVQTAELAGEITFKPCPEPCKYNEWDVEIASSIFPPTEEYFERFIKHYVYTSTAPTFEYIRENMARIHIYYDELKVANKVQTKAYEPQNFIAEFGGTVDLFIGFSFFTVFQLIEISVALCLSKLWARRQEIKRDKKSVRDNGEVHANNSSMTNVC